MENLEGVLLTLEGKVDEELQNLDNLNSQTLEQLRERRVLEIKREASQRQEWLLKGHGEYTEIEEKEFFSAAKSSPDMVVHFYKGDTPRCEIFDHHLKKIAAAHLEARFVKINVMKSPFLAERLKIRVIPTLLIVMDGKSKDYVVGFSDLGNCDNFSTEVLEWRLGISGVIKCDISHPPRKNSKNKGIRRIEKKTIREISSSEDSSD